MVEKENNPPTTSTSVHSSSGEGEEQLVDYTTHEAAEVGVLNRLWYKEAVFYEVCILTLFILFILINEKTPC